MLCQAVAARENMRVRVIVELLHVAVLMAAHTLLLKALGFWRMDLMPMGQQVDFVLGLLVIFS